MISCCSSAFNGFVSSRVFEKATDSVCSLFLFFHRWMFKPPLRIGSKFSRFFSLNHGLSSKLVRNSFNIIFSVSWSNEYQIGVAPALNLRCNWSRIYAHFAVNFSVFQHFSQQLVMFACWVTENVCESRPKILLIPESWPSIVSTSLSWNFSKAAMMCR